MKFGGFTFLVFFLFTYTLGFAAKININSTQPNAPVLIYKYTDYFTYRTETLLQINTNEQGKAEAQFTCNQTHEIFIKINDVNASLYVTPTGIYTITFPEYQGIEANVLSKEKFVDLKIQSESEPKLNLLIKEFNNQIDQLIENNHALFVRKSAGDVIKKFEQETNNQYQAIASDFFKTYRLFAIANLELTTNYSRNLIFEKYIKNFPLYLSNQEFVTFFKNYFQDFARFFATTTLVNKLEAAYTVHQNPDSILNLYNTNKIFSQLSDNQKHLVLINEIYYQFNNGKYNKNALRNVLDLVQTHTPFEDIKHVAAQMQKSIRKMAVGSQAPNFHLTDFNGQTFTLNQFLGKYVYIDFWATWCIPCLNEMKKIAELHQKYGNEVEFISISIDKSGKKMEKFLQKQNYQWRFAHFNNNEKIIEDFQVVAIPLYYLIDPTGKIVQSPALRPAGGIENTFFKIQQQINKQNPNDKIWDWNKKP